MLSEADKQLATEDAKDCVNRCVRDIVEKLQSILGTNGKRADAMLVVNEHAQEIFDASSTALNKKIIARQEVKRKECGWSFGESILWGVKYGELITVTFQEMTQDQEMLQQLFYKHMKGVLH